MQRPGDIRGETDFGLFIGEARVGGAKLDVGHDAVVIPVPALDDDERAFLNLLRRNRQTHAETLFQPTADKIAYFSSLNFHKYLLFKHKGHEELKGFKILNDKPLDTFP